MWKNDKLKNVFVFNLCECVDEIKLCYFYNQMFICVTFEKT